MSVSRAQVEQVARLARLHFDPAELDRLTHDLNAILGHMDELRELDVADVAPFTVVAADATPQRADVPGADPLHVEPSSLAPAWRDGFFTVPRLAAHRHAGGEGEQGP